MPAPGNDTWDEAAWIESVGAGTVRADAVLGAVSAAARQHSADVIWAERVWGLIAGASGVPFVVHDPVRTPGDLRMTDPAWVHVPGAWDGVVKSHLSRALAASDDRAELVGAMKTATAD